MHKDTRTYRGKIEIVDSRNKIKDSWLWGMLHSINMELSHLFYYEEYKEHSYTKKKFEDVINPIKFPEYIDEKLDRKSGIHLYLHTTTDEELMDIVEENMLGYIRSHEDSLYKDISGLKLKLNYTKVAFNRSTPKLWDVEAYVSVKYSKRNGLVTYNKITNIEEQNFSTQDFYFYSDVFVFDTYTYEGTYFLFEFISDMALNPEKYPDYQFESNKAEVLARMFSKHIENEYDKWTSYDNEIIDNFKLEYLQETLQSREGKLRRCSRSEALRVFEEAAPTLTKNIMTKGRM